MKKKFLLFFICLIMIPFFVKADDGGIEIKSIKLIEKSDNVVEIEQPKYEELKVYFNLKFFEVNDNAKYKIVVRNTDDEDYRINDEKVNFSTEKYIEYLFSYDDSSNIVKAGTEKEFTVSVVYKNEVLDEDYVDNLYKNDNYANLSFTKVGVMNESDVVVDNPDTNIGMILFLSFVVIVSFVLLAVSIRKKNALYGIVGLMMMVPVLVKAEELFKTEVNVHVEIEKKIELGKFSLCATDMVYQFEIGMNFRDWVNSKYNTTGKEFSDEGLDMEGYGIFYDYDFSYECTSRPLRKCGVGYVSYEDFIEEGHHYYCEGIAECVSPDSEILISLDGDTRLAKNIKENDDIVYYDFVDKEMKVGKVKKSYVHKDATQFVRYTLEDGSYLEATDYHPIYTLNGWKSYTNRNGYETPVVGDRVKTSDGYVKITKIETYTGKEDFVDFKVVSKDGVIVDNYYANGMLVHSAY